MADQPTPQQLADQLAEAARNHTADSPEFTAANDAVQAQDPATRAATYTNLRNR